MIDFYSLALIALLLYSSDKLFSSRNNHFPLHYTNCFLLSCTVNFLFCITDLAYLYIRFILIIFSISDQFFLSGSDTGPVFISCFDLAFFFFIHIHTCYLFLIIAFVSYTDLFFISCTGHTFLFYTGQDFLPCNDSFFLLSFEILCLFFCTDQVFITYTDHCFFYSSDIAFISCTDVVVLSCTDRLFCQRKSFSNIKLIYISFYSTCLHQLIRSLYCVFMLSLTIALTS